MAERELGAWTQIHNVEIICLLAVQACLLSDSVGQKPPIWSPWWCLLLLWNTWVGWLKKISRLQFVQQLVLRLEMYTNCVVSLYKLEFNWILALNPLGISHTFSQSIMFSSAGPALKPTHRNLSNWELSGRHQGLLLQQGDEIFVPVYDYTKIFTSGYLCWGDVSGLSGSEFEWNESRKNIWSFVSYLSWALWENGMKIFSEGKK